MNDTTTDNAAPAQTRGRHFFDNLRWGERQSRVEPRPSAMGLIGRDVEWVDDSNAGKGKALLLGQKRMRVYFTNGERMRWPGCRRHVERGHVCPYVGHVGNGDWAVAKPLAVMLKLHQWF